MKYLTTSDTEPANSTARQAIAQALPVFTFPIIEVGLSPFWSPPHNIQFVNGYIQAATTGSALGGWAVMKNTNLNPDGEVLALFNLNPDKRKTTFTFDNSVIPKIISPAERLYIASFAASGHTNVTVQLFGERIL